MFIYKFISLSTYKPNKKNHFKLKYITKNLLIIILPIDSILLITNRFIKEIKKTKINFYYS